MLFNSIQFAVFFIVVTTAYFALPHRYRWFMLLSASCYFYMAFVPAYILILVVTILIDYVAGIYIESSQGQRRKLYLTISIIANLGVLAIFKYFNFFNENLATAATWLGWNYPVHDLSILLPIGLSFHTFQSLSYTIEVYRGRQQAERHLGIFALYVMFYPQLVAGPIERPQNVLPQLHAEHRFDYARVTSGLRLMAWGFLKKMVIADRLAMFVDTIYGDPTQYTGFPLLLATYFFAIQIYCDFSGYSDIAVGSARVMGIRLMENFNLPYISTSIPEFWRRWHISLSTWFRDYLYFPLGGNRVGRWRWFANIMIVFTISGLWHGASWNFVIWGALHGLYMIVTALLAPVITRTLTTYHLKPDALIWKIIGWGLTVNLVSFAWIFFRATTFSDAWYIITHLFSDFQLRFNFGFGLGLELFIIVGLLLVLMEAAQWAHGAKRFHPSRLPLLYRWSGYYLVIVMLALFAVLESKAQFIYFQF